MFSDLVRQEFPVGTGIYRSVDGEDYAKKRVPCRYRDIPTPC